jgi:uncharacterized membrane protein (UPF0127 family)
MVFLPPSTESSRRFASGVALCLVAATHAYWFYRERVPIESVELSTPRGVLHAGVADTLKQRAEGLSNRDVMTGDGLLLLWSAPGRHPIWMAGMRFALDLIWLDSDDRVLAVLPDVPPCISQPCPVYEPLGTEQSQGVLEVSAGAASRHGIVRGILLRRQELRHDPKRRSLGFGCFENLPERSSILEAVGTKYSGRCARG